MTDEASRQRKVEEFDIADHRNIPEYRCKKKGDLKTDISNGIGDLKDMDALLRSLTIRFVIGDLPDRENLSPMPLQKISRFSGNLDPRAGGLFHRHGGGLFQHIFGTRAKQVGAHHIVLGVRSLWYRVLVKIKHDKSPSFRR